MDTASLSEVFSVYRASRYPATHRPAGASMSIELAMSGRHARPAENALPAENERS